MRKRFLVTLAIISGTMAISLSGCQSEGGKEEPKTTQASKGTEEDKTDDKLASNETQKTDETEKKNETDKSEETEKPDGAKVTKAPDMDATQTKEPVGGVKDGNGNYMTKRPGVTAPPYDEIEGAYEDENGQILVDNEDGTSTVIWSPYYDVDEVLAQIQQEEMAEDDGSTPTEYSKSDEAIVLLDSKGEVKEFLDSTDKDYISLYNNTYQYYSHACYPTVDDVRPYMEKQNECCDDSMKWTEEEIEETITTKSSVGEKYISGYSELVAFNEDRTYARMSYILTYETAEGEENQIRILIYFKKYGDKWLKTKTAEETTSSYVN